MDRKDKFVTPGEDLKIVPPSASEVDEGEEMSEEEKTLLRAEAAAALEAEVKVHGAMHEDEDEDEDESDEDENAED